MEENRELTYLYGRISAVLFRNEENGYAVIKLKTENDEFVTVVGIIPNAAPGLYLEAHGEWSVHQTHGSQFKAELSHTSMPSDKTAVFEYLAGGALHGIGPATATLIIDKFGERALSVIENEPDKLAEIRGISLKKARDIQSRYKKLTEMRDLVEFMCSFKLKPILALNLYKHYGKMAMATLRENPYLIARAFIGGSFHEADMLAMELGVGTDNPERIRAAIIYELRYNAARGHCFIPYEKLIDITARFIGTEETAISEGIDLLIAEKTIKRSCVAGQDACYLENLYEAESYTAKRLIGMANARGRAIVSDKKLKSIEKSSDIELHEMQLLALKKASEHKLMVITGGPGTGKTTAVGAILKMYDAAGIKTMLTAPTGRAAQRMTELTGRDAQTIHRLLGASFAEDEEEAYFAKDEDDPLDCDAVILDECSMVDITLISALLRAMPEGSRLILVGDADQLPSIGPGNVFSDILRSDCIEAIRLTEIFRQSEKSRIVSFAHAINRGEHPELSSNKGDFFFLRRKEQEQLVDTVVDLCSRRLPESMDIKAEDIQVISPTRKGIAGTLNLNKRLQEALNPEKPGKNEKYFAEAVYRVGDRVMQNRNNYDIIYNCDTGSGIGVYNGETGYITEIDTANETLSVDFSGNVATYSFDMLLELEHAWAVTVHKSQGSEYGSVVLCIARAAGPLLSRRLLYTAVTRAKNLLIAVGDDEIAHRMIDEDRVQKRYSGLRARLNNKAGNE